MSDPVAGKRAAAWQAAVLVEDGMRLGLGTGSTFLLVLEALAARMRKEKLDVAGVPTSTSTEAAARRLGLPLLGLDEVEELDLCIDGADEVDPHKNLVKGGGGALVRERIVAAAAREMVVVVDAGKLVEVLGKAFKLPVEVMQFGWKQAARAVEATGCRAALRRGKDGAPFLSDNGNHVLDCDYGGIDDPVALQRELDAIPGVVDSGLFVGMAGRVLVGDGGGKVRVID